MASLVAMLAMTRGTVTAINATATRMVIGTGSTSRQDKLPDKLPRRANGRSRPSCEGPKGRSRPSCDGLWLPFADVWPPAGVESRMALKYRDFCKGTVDHN